MDARAPQTRRSPRRLFRAAALALGLAAPAADAAAVAAPPDPNSATAMTIPLPEPLFWDPTRAGGDYAVVEQASGIYLLRSATGRVVARLRAPQRAEGGQLEGQPTYGPLEYTETLASPSGWPFLPGDEVTTTPVVEDLEGDGSAEVVFATRSGWLWVLGRDGLPPAGWPVHLGASCFSSPALADLDVDGQPEILVGDARGSVHAVCIDGSSLRGWPGAVPGELELRAIYGAVVASDLDGDQRPEVIVCQSGGRVCVLEGDGTVRPGWPVATAPAGDPANAGTIFARPAVGDLDGDGRAEIVAAANNYRVHVWDASGRPLRGWPHKLSTRARVGYTEPVLADLDGDGRWEILVSTDQGFNGPPRIYALDARARNVSGWPVDLPERCNAGVAVGDLNGDARPEVVAATVGANCYVAVFDHRGRSVPGFPVALADMSANASPLLADINGDDRPDILLATSRTLFEPAAVIMAIDARGRPLPAFPIQIDGCEVVSGGACVADLDSDGLLELVLGTEVQGQIHVWDLHGKDRPESAPWPRPGFDARNSGFVRVLPARPRVEPRRPPITTAGRIENSPPADFPFPPLESVTFLLEQPGHVRLSVRQVDAAHVRTLLNVDLPPGSYTIHWDGKNDGGLDVAPGVYFYELDAPGRRRVTGQLLLLR